MAETAAHLVDAVLPEVPVRQWVLSLPYDIRFPLAYDPALLAGVRRIFLRALLAWMRRHAERHGIASGQSGAVCVIQRFDSAVKLNPHLHVLVLDGVYTVTANGFPLFHETPPPSNDDVARLNETVAHRVRRFLLRSGRFTEQGPDPGDSTDASDALAVIAQAAVYGLSAQSRTRQTLLGKHPDLAAGLRSRRCTRYLGFSLHADVRISSCCRDRLERLVRYVARGPICNERLERTKDGQVLYRFKKRWKDGTCSVVLSPIAFLERLCALIPRPRLPLITYHGVLAPAARLRPAIVPLPPEPVCSHPQADATGPPPPKPPRRGQRRYYAWAELIRRVWLVDVLICGRCQGLRKILAAITDPLVVRRILAHLGLPTQPPAVAQARSPPGFTGDYGA